MHITALNETILLVVKFRIRGNLRFLSHAETVKVFQRACVRAGIELQYSRGFNPRPKLSLPLPRTVGVESEDDLLTIRVHRDRESVPCVTNEPRTTNHESRIKDRLSRQLPDGCEVLSVSVAKANASFQPYLATYTLLVQRKYLNENLKNRIKYLLESESLNIQRRIKAKKPKVKNVDVKAFLKSIGLGDNGRILVECKISPAGSIRVEEILKLLELEPEKLAAPIRRTAVQWQQT